ncbi:hypothetical protein LZ198_32260 [Myxococcus sp. K15C18031901]|uniref:hypothetical protein n=1 Tax=Myxococcus dinghuensis TaxID=2906761 RepID=UPI0020A8048B|nr:hypothetical protein [Myxococcus dinghuensis]MCP3103568.1 hypothetical protein [Myxococcus dinghuensis]
MSQSSQFPIEPGVTVTGASVYSIVEAIQSFSVLVDALLDVMKVVPRADGTRTIDQSHWYPIEDYLLAYKKIDTLLGGRGLEKVGSMIPKNAVFPPNVADIHAALGSIDVAFHMNHRKHGKEMFNPATGEMVEGIGHYSYTPTAGKKEGVLVAANPYPCRFDQGLIKGMAQRFAPDAAVTHDPAHGCRQKGGGSCTYVITW